MVLHSPSRTKCVSMVKAEVILRFFAFEWFCADTLALNAVKKTVKLRFFGALQPNVCPPSEFRLKVCLRKNV